MNVLQNLLKNKKLQFKSRSKSVESTSEFLNTFMAYFPLCPTSLLDVFFGDVVWKLKNCSASNFLFFFQYFFVFGDKKFILITRGYLKVF